MLRVRRKCAVSNGGGGEVAAVQVVPCRKDIKRRKGEDAGDEVGHGDAGGKGQDESVEGESGGAERG